MRASIVRIGNSRGIRIPKTLLEQCRLDGAVDLEVRGDSLVLRAVAAPRAGWDDAFHGMARSGDDVGSNEHWPATRWDETEWEW